MINVTIKCSQTIEQYMQEFLRVNNIFLSPKISENTILIIEINSANDVANLKLLIKKTKNIYIICVVEDNEIIFNIMDTIHPLNIWRKKFITEDCLNLLNILNIQHSNIHKIMTYKSSNNYIQVNSSNIIYIESFGHYLTFHTLHSSFRTRKRISEALTELTDLEFIRIHKSYVVNKKFIYSISSRECVLSNDKSLPVGSKYQITL